MKTKWNAKRLVPLLVVLAVGAFIGRLTAPDPLRGDGTIPQAESRSVRAASPKVESGAVRARTGRAVFQGIPARDLETLARSAAESPDEIENEALLRVLVSEWAMKDPEAAIAFAQELKKDDLVSEALSRMAQLDPEAALRWLSANAGSSAQQRAFAMAVYQGMARTDPSGTIARLEQMPAGTQQDELLTLAIHEWAKQDIQAAFDWLGAVELTPRFEAIYSQVMGNFIEQDPAGAAALIAEMASCGSKLTFAPQVACKLAEKDVGSAIEWVDHLDGEERKYALMGVLDRWAEGPDAKGALDFILRKPEEPGYQNLLETVVFRMSQHQPEELAVAMKSMEESEKGVAAEHLAAAYSVSSPKRCREWLDSLEAGSIRDRAVERALVTFTQSNVSMAFELTESISSEPLRKTRMREVMNAWIAVDAVAAESALGATSALNASEKGALLNEVRGNFKANDYVIPGRASH